MGRYFIKFCYRGTQYRGAQKSVKHPVKDPDSIQGAIECAFNKLLPKPLSLPYLVLSSRTDVGVHALQATGHVDLSNKYGAPYSPEKILKVCNQYFANTNHEIRIHDCIPVTEEFHVRRLILSRTYHYRFMTPKEHEEKRIPMMDLPYTFFFSKKNFDIQKVKDGLSLFMGPKDWTTFSKKSISNKPIVYRRQLTELTLTEAKPIVSIDPLSELFNYWEIRCTARSFLYNQVRRMVTALLALGTGLLTPKDIVRMFQVPNHNYWEPHMSLVHPDGLFLVSVQYDEEELNKFITQIEEPSTDDNILSNVKSIAN